MNHVNLIPRARRERRRARVLRRRWSTACATYAFMVFLALLASRLQHVGDNRALQATIDTSETESVANQQLIFTLRADLLRSVDLLRANRAVGSQPDWSVLLGLIGQATEDEIVLRQFRAGVGPVEQAAPGPSSSAATEGGAEETLSPSAPTRLTLEGLGRSQDAVSRFVLRMDGIPLFEEVKLVDTRREPFLDSHATSFRVECVIDPGGGAAAP